MDHLKPVALRILKKDRVVLLAVLGTMGRTLDIPSSRPFNYFTNSIDFFTCADPKRDTGRVWLMRRIFCKAKEGFTRKRFCGRGAAPFPAFFTPPHRKTELRQQSSVEVGHVGETAHAQIDMTKWVSTHRMFQGNALSIGYFHGKLMLSIHLINSPLKRSLALAQKMRRHRWQMPAFLRSILIAAPSSTEA